MALPTAFRESGIVLPAVESYLEGISWGRDPLLATMHAHALEQGIPIVSDDVGQLLDLLVRIHRPAQIVEFGTAIGYSTVYMSRALPDGSKLTTFEIDQQRHMDATDYLSQAGSGGTVEVQLGDGRELIRALTHIDFAFLDATKGQYEQYLDLVLERMPAGGVVVVDNALMSGCVAVNEPDEHWSQASIDGQRVFNARFSAAAGAVRGTILPIGDGVGLGVRL